MGASDAIFGSLRVHQRKGRDQNAEGLARPPGSPVTAKLREQRRPRRGPFVRIGGAILLTRAVTLLQDAAWRLPGPDLRG
jgi:hypothetical protein